MTYKDIPGYCDFHDFYKEVFDQLPDGANIAEVGVYLGHSVAYMATLANESRKKFRIFAIDTFQGSQEHKLTGDRPLLKPFFHNIIQCDVFDQVNPIDTDSISAAKMFVCGQLDFCFIDAAHNYESVKADINAWQPKVKPGGILAGHDYCDSWPGVKKAVDELLPNRQLNKSVWMIRK